MQVEYRINPDRKSAFEIFFDGRKIGDLEVAGTRDARIFRIVIMLNGDTTSHECRSAQEVDRWIKGLLENEAEKYTSDQTQESPDTPDEDDSGNEGSNPDFEHALEMLRRAVGSNIASFRDGQWEAIDNVINGENHVLLVQRTGWGKSSVYFISTKILRERGKGLTLLISPLLSLMRNQLVQAHRLGLRAAAWNSTNRDEWSEIRAALFDDEIDVLLISPERLADDVFVQGLLIPIAERIGLFVIDEAHCISDWGHDFRPDYRRIVRIIERLPENIPVLSTTATANDRVVDDVKAQLGQAVKVERGPLTRTTLQLQTIKIQNPAGRLALLAQNLSLIEGTGIIYTLTIRYADRIAAWLQSQDINAQAYHGNLANEPREELEEQLIGNQVKALVATTALGMGFDKPDLAFVIHFQAPQSVVHYYQQVGRAGRALDDAVGLLMSGSEDKDINSYFIEEAFPNEAQINSVLGLLDESDNGLTVSEIESEINLRRSIINKVLKFLSVEDNTPIVKDRKKWVRTANTYQLDLEHIEGVTNRRWREWDEIQKYLETDGCLMQYLANALGDPLAEPCGRCENCRGEPILSSSLNDAIAREAVTFLQRSEFPIVPRRNWPDIALSSNGWHGRIAPALRNEEGRVLCFWGDPGWGELVREGKESGRFKDELVDAIKEMIEERWQPLPKPEWVTCIPSLRHPTLVQSFAERLSGALDLPFEPAIEKVRETRPQKEMQNSQQQASNLDGAFAIQENHVQEGPVLLIDDMVDSKWSFTVCGALLKSGGSGQVYPVALASTATV